MTRYNEKTRNKDKYGSIKIHDVENTTVINKDRIKTPQKNKWGTCMSQKSNLNCSSYYTVTYSW